MFALLLLLKESPHGDDEEVARLLGGEFHATLHLLLLERELSVVTMSGTDDRSARGIIARLKNNTSNRRPHEDIVAALDEE